MFARALRFCSHHTIFVAIHATPCTHHRGHRFRRGPSRRETFGRGVAARCAGQADERHPRAAGARLERVDDVVLHAIHVRLFGAGVGLRVLARAVVVLVLLVLVDLRAVAALRGLLLLVLLLGLVEAAAPPDLRRRLAAGMAQLDAGSGALAVEEIDDALIKAGYDVEADSVV